MLTETLHTRAALYVAGALSGAEREAFELLLEYRGELRQPLAELQEVGAALALADLGPAPAAPAGLKARLLDTLVGRPQPAEPDAVVVTDPAGRLEWVNPAFTRLCGYALDELRGRKPGELLQGPETDTRAVARIRQSVQERRPCRETLINYHKDGSPYHVDISISPFLDDDGQPLWFVAKERRLGAAPVAKALSRLG